MAERTRRRSTSARGKAAAAESGGSGGGRLNRDYSEEEYREPSEGYQGEQPTKGLYTCELFDIRDHTSKDDNESVRWGFRLVDGSENKHGDDVSGFPDFLYTNENTAWREQQMLVAVGVIKPGGKVNLGYDAIVKKAKPCTVKIGVERYIPEDGGDPEDRGRMQAFLTLRDPATAKKSRRAVEDDEPAEDPFDDDADAEDEPEEKPARRQSSRSRRKAAEPEPESEDDEDESDLEDEPYDPDELAAELEELSLAALKKRARDEFGIKIKRGDDADAIIDAVLDTLDENEDDEDEPETEPEPEPAKRRSSRSEGKTGSRRTRGTGGNEPPF